MTDCSEPSDLHSDSYKVYLQTEGLFNSTVLLHFAISIIFIFIYFCLFGPQSFPEPAFGHESKAYFDFHRSFSLVSMIYCSYNQCF